jgi:hypothetical protein
VIGNPVDEEHAEPLEAEVSAQLAEEELVTRIHQVGAYETCDRLVVQTLSATTPRPDPTKYAKGSEISWTYHDAVRLAKVFLDLIYVGGESKLTLCLRTL